MSHIANQILLENLIEFSEELGVSPRQMIAQFESDRAFPPKVEDMEQEELDHEDLKHELSASRVDREYRDQEIAALNSR